MDLLLTCVKVEAQGSLVQKARNCSESEKILFALRHEQLNRKQFFGHS